MMPISNNLTTVLVANLATAMKAAGTTIRSYSDLSDGQLALVNQANLSLNPATAISNYTYPVRFVVRNGDKLVYSDWILYNAANVHVQKTYAADTQQVSYVGYNGTSGSLDVFDLNEYIINIEIKDEDVATAVYPYMKHGAYYSDSAATQAEIGLGLVSSLVSNFKREPQSRIQFDLVCSAAGTAISNDAGDTVVGYKGSDVLVIADATDDNDIAVLAVGDFVRIGTATTAAVYKIISGSTTAAAGGTLKLDRPLVASVSLAGTTAEYITAAEALAADFGIKMTSVARTNFVPGVQKHYLTTFKVFLARGFETTAVTYTTAATYGAGTYQEVAEMEYIAQGNTGKKVYIGVPPFVSRSAASSATTYTRNTYTFSSDGYAGIISNNPTNKKVLYIYTGTGGQADTDVAAVL